MTPGHFKWSNLKYNLYCFTVEKMVVSRNKDTDNVV